MHKHYLTVQQTRIYALDNPVGDAYGYGKPQMPIAAVALAAGSFAAGVTAFAAATTMVGMVAAGAMMVGGALTIVGTVTGNAKLTKIGGMLSLAGGLGTMALGAADGLAATGGQQMSDAGGALDVAGGSASGGADALAGSAPTPATEVMQLPSSTPNAQTVAGPGGNAQGAGMINSAGPGAPQLGADASAPMAARSVDAMSTSGTQVGQATGIDAFANESAKVLQQQGMAQNGTGLLNSGTPSVGPGGFFDKAGNWVKNNKELAKMGVDAAGGLLGSLSPSDKEKAEIAYLRQKEQENRQRQLWRQGRTA